MLPPQQGRDDSLRARLAQGREANVPKSMLGVVFPAVQLFVERAAESLEGFELNDTDAPVVADICRKLEGIALAIELAATRIDALGARELSALLDDRFRLLKQGRRTAVSRHRTLAATLDWSYELLPEDERIVLRRLAVFAGAFTLESASAVARGTGIAAPEVVQGVANLVEKSLVSADVSGAVAQYRLIPRPTGSRISGSAPDCRSADTGIRQSGRRRPPRCSGYAYHPTAPQAAAGLHWLGAAGKDRYTVPALLPHQTAPYRHTLGGPLFARDLPEPTAQQGDDFLLNLRIVQQTQ